MADLETVLTPDAIVVADASYATIWMSCYLTARAPGMRFLSPRGMAGLGWGLPLAMGAKVADPSRPVFAIVGDGGFAHVWSELETAVRNQTAVVLTVLNNGVLGFQKDAEDHQVRPPHRRLLLRPRRPRRHRAGLRRRRRARR